MAEIIKDPELRYTSDNQMAIANMFVQFTPPFGSRPEDPHPTLEAIGWGNMATEIKEKYRKGDRVIIEGRLEMNTLEIDGYKEKHARLVVSRCHPLTGEHTPTANHTAATEPSNRVVPFPTVNEEPPAMDFSQADDEHIPF
jgi:single-stranded DNA-binding protein